MAVSRVYEARDLSVVCTFCGRGVGQRCKKPNGQDAIGPHEARKIAAGLSTTR